MQVKPKFKTDQGVYFTKGLFFETAPLAEKPHVMYTLKNEDHNGLPSLKRLYLEMEDVMEYEFSNTYLGGWDHWIKIKECEWFKAHLNAWREELELKLKTRAYKAILAKANDSLSKDQTRSNEFIINTLRRIQRGEDLGEKNTKGRPDKDSIDKKALELATDRALVEDDAKRILNS